MNKTAIVQSLLFVKGQGYSGAISADSDRCLFGRGKNRLCTTCTTSTDDVAQTVACSIVASRLDYCNALLSGAPTPTFKRLHVIPTVSPLRLALNTGGLYKFLDFRPISRCISQTIKISP